MVFIRGTLLKIRKEYAYFLCILSRNKAYTPCVLYITADSMAEKMKGELSMRKRTTLVALCVYILAVTAVMSLYMMRRANTFGAHTLADTRLIEVRSGTTGHLTSVDDAKSVFKITRYFSDFDFTRSGEQPQSTGYGYALRFYDAGGDEIVNLTVMTTNRFVYDGRYYDSAENAIDVNYLATLTERE